MFLSGLLLASYFGGDELLCSDKDEPWKDFAMCEHRVQFYDTEAFLLRKVFDFVVAAFRNQGAVVVIATASHLEQLGCLLAEHESVPGGHRRLVCLDARQTLDLFMVDGMPDAQRFEAVIGVLLEEVSDAGTRTVQVFGEMVALLYVQGKAVAAVRLEQLWEDLGQRRVFSLLCAYPMQAFPGEGHRSAFKAICDAHTEVAPLECLDAVAVEPQQLHRVVARLQQSTNALEHELAHRRRSDRLLDRQAARITALERAQAALKDLAGHDALTGLFNRRAFGECLSRALARARRMRTHVALLFIDLDDFKGFNDRFGHPAGDQLLQEAGTRLGACVRASDTVCRIGGDEFTIVMEDADAQEAALLAQRVVDALAEPFTLGQQKVRLTASIGLGLYPDDAADAQGLIHRADRAMYHAKALGKACYADPCRAGSPVAGPDALERAAAGVRTDQAAAAGTAGATPWMTVAGAALQLGLSRPHVAKLIVERRFANVIPQDGALPLIPATEVSRVGQELQLGERHAPAG